MWSPSILMLTILAYATGKYEVQKAKLGDSVTLKVEAGVQKWKRVKSDKTTEYVEYCGGKVGLGCSIFVDKNGRPSCPTSSVTVHPNGTLTLHFLWEGDTFANYSSSDATPEKDSIYIYLEMEWAKQQ